MSEVKHTAGPWTVRHAPMRGASNDTWCIDWSEDQEEVAEIVHGEANAHLIAAAPELLHMAHMVMAWWNKHQYDTTGEQGEFNTYETEPEFVTAARAAITKAESI